MADFFFTSFPLSLVWICDQYQGGAAVIPPLYPPRKEVNAYDTGPVIIFEFPLVFLLF